LAPIELLRTDALNVVIGSTPLIRISATAKIVRSSPMGLVEWARAEVDEASLGLNSPEVDSGSPGGSDPSRSSNALRCVAGHSAMLLSAASSRHMGVTFAGISMPVVGGVLR
jgi:hypothetical protein